MRFVDTLYNYVSGLGTAKDKSSFNTFTRNLLQRDQIDNAYRSDWIARKIINVPVQDATREWRDWQADEQQIEKIEEVEKELDVQRKLVRAMRLGRLYGGGALILGVEGAGNMTEELDLERVREGSLKFIHAVSRYEITAGQVNGDLQSELYGEPEYYERQAAVGAIDGQPIFRIHPTRVIRFFGNEYPGNDVAGFDAWSDSVMETLADAIKQTGAVVGGISALVNEAKVDVIKVPNLMRNLTTKGYSDKLQQRFELANIAKSHTNTIMLDTEEEWDRITTSFAALPDVLKVYLLIAAGAADIPATRLIGQSAQGLNATGDGDLKNYYDRVRSDQTNELSPVLQRLDEVLIRSALGTRDPAIHYMWAPLYTLDETQKADLAAKKADTMTKDVAAGLISLEVLAEGRKNQLIEDGTYPGFEAALEEFDSDVPPAEEARQLNQESQQKLLAAPVPDDPNAPPAKGGNGDGDKDGIPNEGGKSKKKPFGDGMFSDFNDAEPRTLYVRRNLLNKDDVVAWATEQGLTDLIEDMHVTIIYSKTAVNWMKAGGNDWGQETDGTVKVAPGGPRMIDLLGPPGAEDTLVLMFACSGLSYRNAAIRQETGASFDYDEYQPHVSLTKTLPADLKILEPYRGELRFGPEIFEEVKSKGND